MTTLRQFLGGLVGGAVVVALIAGGLLLSAGDLNIAFRPPPTAQPVVASSPTESPQPATATFLPTSTHTPTLFPTGACPRPAGWVDHVIAAGEDLAGIADQFNIDVALLQVNNCLLDAVVVPDQVIFVPPLPTDTPTATRLFTASPTVCGPPRGWPAYIVKAGDTLSSIARATGTTVATLMLANCLPSDRIRVGQVLYVPRLPGPIVTITFTPTRTPTPSPTATGSFTPTPSLTPSATQPTSAPPSATPTATPSLPATPSPTATGTPVEVQSPTPTPTIDASPTATDTIPPTVSVPTPTPTPSPTAS